MRKIFAWAVLLVILSFVGVYAASVYTIGDFESGDLSEWMFNYHYQPQGQEGGAYASDQGEGPNDPVLEVVDGGANGTAKCLQFSNNLAGAWVGIDIVVNPDEVKDALQPKMLSFFIKNEEGVKEMIVEAYEQDGTRWRATVPITSEWKEVKLAPRYFKYLLGGDGRGGSKDEVRLGELTRIGFTIDGMANGNGNKVFYVDEIELK